MTHFFGFSTLKNLCLVHFLAPQLPGNPEILSYFPDFKQLLAIWGPFAKHKGFCYFGALGQLSKKGNLLRATQVILLFWGPQTVEQQKGSPPPTA
jgi:hypothetical protein